MRPIRLTLLAIAAILHAGVPSHADPAKADPTAKKVNGDSPGDTAPLATGKSDSAPLDNANFPPPGGATNGAGPNPQETGPIDANKAPKK